MGLAFLLGVIHLVPSSTSRREEDLEKDAPGAEEARPDDEQAVEDSADEDDEGLEDPLADGPRRLHRLSTATRATFFSTRLPRSLTLDSLAPSRRRLFSRIKSYIFPGDENEATLEKFIPNYRWTPILSGVVIPFSILLEIPGLTEHWYVRTEANKIVETRSNSVILDVGLAFSMACALCANICLVLRFLEKRVKTVTLLTILFLTTHDIINIICVITFGVAHRSNDGFTYGQSFWLTLCSTAASVVSNVTLITDYVRTPAFAQSGSGLTRKQRALMIIVIVLLVYIALGALINSFIQGLNFIDGLYFTVVTIETIGFGDITPNSTGARIFTCFYMVIGVINLGVAVAMTRETVLEGLELGYRKRLRDLRLRRREARRFRRWEARWKRAVEWRLKKQGQPVWISDDHLANEGVRFVGLSMPEERADRVPWTKRWLNAIGLWRTLEGPPGLPRGKHLNIDALTPQQLEAAALEAGVPLEMFLKSPRDESYEEHLSRANSDQSQERPGVRENIRRPTLSAWPTYSQTPTHAQVGRMSAMVTKFAMAVTGTHVHMIGHGVESQATEERQEQARRDTAPTRDDPVWSPPSDAQDNGQESMETATGDPQEKQPAPQVPPQPLQTGKLVAEGRLPPSTSQWTRDLARGRSQRSHILNEQLKKDMKNEERRAHIAKLTISWTLFLIFWTVGSAIFSATEGWPYGDALYFSVTAFTTTGYGDFAPASPAGRSIFVVWALLGVATMTILISVIEEAGSSRYRRALHSKTFDNAVKKYRMRESQITHNMAFHNRPHAVRMHSNASSLNAAVKAAQVSVQRELEGLPNQIIHQARTFFDHMRYFVNKSGQSLALMENNGEMRTRIPSELKELLDEIAQLEEIGERTKREILEDTDSRNTLLMLSIERTLRTLINSAERALGALAERDDLLEASQSLGQQSSQPQAHEEDIASRDFAVEQQ